MLALIWLAYGCFGITVGTIPPLVEPIVHDLGISYGQMGLVLGAWQLIYVGTASPLGVLVDRLGPRRSLSVGIGVVLLSLVLRGLAVDFATLFLSVALFGLGGPVISIGAPKVVSVWFEGNERGLAAGIYSTGPAAGTTLALATAAPVVMPLFGTWRAVPFVYGAFVLVVMLTWIALARDAPPSPSRRSPPAPEGAVPFRAVLGELLRLRNVQIILVLAIATFFLNHGLNSWLPTLLQERGMTLAQAGAWTAASTGAGAMGVLFVPHLARYGRRSLALGILLAMAAGSTLGLAFLSGAPLAAALLVSGVARNPMMPVCTLMLMDTPGVGSRRMGAAGGLFFAAAEIGGFNGPLVLGLFRDLTGSLSQSMAVLAAITTALVLVLPFLHERPSKATARPT